MLQWFYTFGVLVLTLIFSLIFVNRNLVGMILIGEFSIIFLFLMGIALSSYSNIYYALLFSFFLLVIGGLELALNLLLILL